MKILIACEESQAVLKQFRLSGHDAYSNDIIGCSGDMPEYHLKMDVFEAINLKKWDMIIAFPPCTFLTCTGNRWFNIERYGEKAIQRHKDREKAIEFFKGLINADCDKIAIENPIGVMSTRYRKPNQVIHPFMFGHKITKATCLWLKGLPEIKPTNIVDKGEVVISKSGNKMSKWYYGTSCLPHNQRAKARSKTFEGIAKAFASQWG